MTKYAITNEQGTLVLEEGPSGWTASFNEDAPESIAAFEVRAFVRQSRERGWKVEEETK